MLFVLVFVCLLKLMCCLFLLFTEQRQGLAHYLTNPVALAEAMAYTMTQVSELSDWHTAMETSYELVPFSKCCAYNTALPKDFVMAVRNTKGEAQ